MLRNSTRHYELGGLQCASQIVHRHIAGSRKKDPASKGLGYIHARMLSAVKGEADLALPPRPRCLFFL